MSNTKNRSAGTKQTMDKLQNELDFAVFEQDEMDVEKVKEILGKMEEISPDEDKDVFNKELLWAKIKEECSEEFAEENVVKFSNIKAGGDSDKVANEKVGKSRKSKGGSGKVRRIALTAATIVIAVFVGANIGTYATEKKNVIEYVQDLQNGTSFWVTGDTPSMEIEKEKQVYYSWNDVPNEYKEFLVIPQGMPEDMGLYDIEIWTKGTVNESIIRYIDEEAKRDLTIQIISNEKDEFTFANVMYENGYELLEKRKIDNFEISYYMINGDEFIAQFVYSEYIYILSGTLENEEIQVIAEKTIESNL